MTEQEWEVQADRLGAAWPASPMTGPRRAVYFDVLRDLDVTAVDQAISALLREDRSKLPAPGEVRARAASVVGRKSFDRSFAADSSRTVDAAAGSDDKASSAKQTSGKGGLALVFSVIGLAPIGLWLGISALRDGQRDPALAEDRANRGMAIAAIVVGALSLAIAVVLAGVVLLGGSDEGTSPGAQTPPAAAPIAEPDAGDGSAAQAQDVYLAVGDSFRDGNFGLRLTALRRVGNIEGFTAAPGSVLVRVDIAAVNLSSQPVNGPICGTDFYGVVLVDDQSRNYAPDSISSNFAASTNALCVNAVQPGMTSRIVLAFVVPKAAAPGISGAAIWDPTEDGDPDGDTYYFVNGRL